MSTLNSFPQDFSAIVIGGHGGIGQAFCQALRNNTRCLRLLSFSRNPVAEEEHFINLDDEASIAAAAEEASAHGPYHLIINATGRLHGPQLMPEKTFRHLSHAALMEYYQANCIAPIMAAKHFLPLLARHEKAVYGILSARVGSISDNRIGGWHGYRAAKAGLNMMIRNLAIEMALKSKEAIILGLHPGTVETGLSAPFRSKVKHDIFTPEASAHHLLNVIDHATTEQSGSQLAWDGRSIPE